MYTEKKKNNKKNKKKKQNQVYKTTKQPTVMKEKNQSAQDHISICQQVNSQYYVTILLYYSKQPW